jgi:hypothetical protein
MPKLINENTLEMRKSLDDTIFTPAKGWHNAENMTLPDCEPKYRKWNSSEKCVVEMDQVEKDVVDSLELENQRMHLKESYISQKIRSLAIEALKVDGILDSNGEII